MRSFVRAAIAGALIKPKAINRPKPPRKRGKLYKRRGVRLCGIRALVLAILRDGGSAMSAAQVVAAASNDGIRISAKSAYDAMQAMAVSAGKKTKRPARGLYTVNYRG